MLGLRLLATQGSYYVPANGVRLTKVWNSGLAWSSARSSLIRESRVNKRIASVRLELIDSL